MKTPFPSTSLRYLVAAGGFLAAVGMIASARGASSDKAPISLKHDDSAIERSKPEPASFADVVKRVSASVVKITVEGHGHGQDMGGEEGPGMDDPVFRHFFGNRRQLREEPVSGLGSGVIISKDGYIVTNNHVVEGAETLTVALSDGREFPAKVVGRDPQTDVAVVKVEASGLPAITFSTTSKVEVGDRVLAIGNPFGIGETVTTGIVSAKGRRAGLGLAYEDFIQTDAAINPGNSGGALVDIQGRMVGMNTAILSRSGGSQGVGLAVPSDLVTYVADTLVQHGKVVRGYLGIGVQDLTPALAESFGIKVNEGAVISDVQPNSPAAKAGLVSGDVVTAINGKPVDSSGKLALSVSESAPGSKITIDLIHDGKAKQLVATATTKPGRGELSGDDSSSSSSDEKGVLNGVAVDDLDPNTREQMNIPNRIKGALIADVASDSASARAGLRPGDVILEINHQPVTNAKDAIELSASATTKKTLLKLWSRGGTVFVVVDETPHESGQ